MAVGIVASAACVALGIVTLLAAAVVVGRQLATEQFRPTHHGANSTNGCQLDAEVAFLYAEQATVVACC